MNRIEPGLGAVILAGGRGRRMGGINKGALTLSGTAFLDRITEELSGYSETLLSVDAPGRYPESRLKQVVDSPAGCGPIGGIASALRVCRSPALVTAAADMPFFAGGVGRYLGAFMDDGCDAVVAVGRDGREHPLCAVYAKSALPVLEKRLASGQYRLMDALAELRVRRAALEHTAYPDAVLDNVNTPEDYARARRRVEGPPALAICGAKNSGKTTLLVRVIPVLVEMGLRVGAVKHDGHEFVPDVPGADSFRLREAGAAGVAVFSETRFMTTGPRHGGSPSFRELIAGFGPVDCIVYEGGKTSGLPKIEVVRAANSRKPVCPPHSLMAVCTDVPDAHEWGVRTFGLDDVGDVAEFIAAYIK